MRIRLKGLNSITKRLADGTRRTYWYAWKGGPPLRGEPGTPEFTASYNAAAAVKVTPPDGVLLRNPTAALYSASMGVTVLLTTTKSLLLYNNDFCILLHCAIGKTGAGAEVAAK
jgi:hypothetical protein